MKNRKAGFAQVLTEEWDVEKLRLTELRVVNQKAASADGAHARLKTVDTRLNRRPASWVRRTCEQSAGSAFVRIVLCGRGVHAPKPARQIVTGDVRPHVFNLIEEIERFRHDAGNHEADPASWRVSLRKRGCLLAELLGGQVLARTDNGIEITIRNRELGTTSV